jgi:uncharacterized protein (DUF1778 family)
MNTATFFAELTALTGSTMDLLTKREKSYDKVKLTSTAGCRTFIVRRTTLCPQPFLPPRLEARISTDLHSMLKRAAELQGRTMTDFVIAAVQDAAQRAIEQAEVIRLSMADQECFAQALLSPPQPSPALERAFARRSKLLRAE